VESSSLTRLSTFETKTREVSRVFVSNVESRVRGTASGKEDVWASSLEDWIYWRTLTRFGENASLRLSLAVAGYFDAIVPFRKLVGL